MNDNVITIFCLTLVLMPYFLFLKKGLNVASKLLFVSLLNILLLGLLFMVYYFTESQKVIAFLFIYNIFVWASVIINIFLLMLWQVKKYFT